MDIAYYPGCSLHQSSQFYDTQAKMVLQELDIKLVEIDDWSCCGATSAGKFDDFLAVALPARNLGIAENAGFKEMMVPCSGCFSSLRMSQLKLSNNKALLDEINKELSLKVKNNLRLLTILEILLSTQESGLFKSKIKKQLTGIKAGCYYGCMTRFAYDVPVSDNIENPVGMEMLLQAAGAETFDWSYKTACCGASAAINDPETALNLMGKIFKDAVAKKLNCLVTTCPMCQLNLDAYQDKFCTRHGIKERLPVYFITELLGVAFGLDTAVMGFEKHFIDTTGLLKELNLI
jgi:heterodisulfide reductase subunit B